MCISYILSHKYNIQKTIKEQQSIEKVTSHSQQAATLSTQLKDGFNIFRDISSSETLEFC